MQKVKSISLRLNSRNLTMKNIIKLQNTSETKVWNSVIKSCFFYNSTKIQIIWNLLEILQGVGYQIKDNWIWNIFHPECLQKYPTVWVILRFSYLVTLVTSMWQRVKKRPTRHRAMTLESWKLTFSFEGHSVATDCDWKCTGHSLERSWDKLSIDCYAMSQNSILAEFGRF